MSETCRVCLIEKEKHNFLNLVDNMINEKTVLEIIIDCAQIEVLDNDPLPRVICISCLEKLHSFYELRQLIVNSDRALKKSLQKINELPSYKYKNLQKKEDACITDIAKFKNLEDCGRQDNSNVRNEEKCVVQNKEFNEESLQPEDLSNFGNNTNLIVTVDKDVSKKSHSADNHDFHGAINKNEKRFKRPPKKIKRTHECKECNKIFKKADHYTVHMTKHTGEKKYACEFCPKRFARSYVLVYHRRVHTGERPYTCNICSKSFSSPSNFYTHKKIHTGEKNYKCEICNESFIQSDSLKIHIRRIHTGERPFLCEICSSAFRSNSSLLTHKLDIHGKKDACPICSKLYSSRVLKEHLRRHKERELGIKRYVCDQCGKRFTCSSSRKKHLLIHSGERPFSCEICEKSFNQRSALKTHMRVHSDYMPFPCDHCSKSFRYKHHLRSHVNVHHKDFVVDISINDNGK